MPTRRNGPVSSNVRRHKMNSWVIPGRYDFSIPEAQRLSDRTGVDVDLESVVRMCSRCIRLINETAPPPENNPMSWWDDLQALGDLMFAAIVRYGRTFNSGVRKGIPQNWIDALPEELRTSHAYFKALRDKFIAHSVNQLEDNQVFVMLTPQFSEIQEPSHITVDRGRLLGISKEDTVNLKVLAEALRSRLSIEMEAESNRLLELARGMSVDQIRARSTESAPIPSKAATFKARSQF